jgi:protein required for attachment to host cells
MRVSQAKASWVVVADAGLARVFAPREDGRALVELADFKELGRQYPEQSGFSDRPARVQESASDTRHAVQPRTDPKAVAAQRFAAELAGFLSTSQREGRFERLIVVAPARFGSRLKAELDPATALSIEHWLGKDLVNHPPVDVFEQVEALL